MPSMDRWEFLHQLHLEEPDHIVIYILSSSVMQDDIEKAGSHPKVAGFTNKPLSSAINGLLISTLSALENASHQG